MRGGATGVMVGLLEIVKVEESGDKWDKLSKEWPNSPFWLGVHSVEWVVVKNSMEGFLGE